MCIFKAPFTQNRQKAPKLLVFTHKHTGIIHCFDHRNNLAATFMIFDINGRQCNYKQSFINTSLHVCTVYI